MDTDEHGCISMQTCCKCSRWNEQMAIPASWTSEHSFCICNDASGSYDNVWEYVWNLSKPTIAMIDGFALGGGSEIALSCDLRLATPRSKFGTPEINLGLIPGGGGTQRLCRLLGYGRAMEMVMRGEMIGGEEANQIGLINHLVDEDDLREKTMEIAQNLATKSPHTIRVAKAAVRTALEQPFSAGIQSERDLFCELFDTADMAIGVKAFLNRETAEWTGA